MENTGLSPAKKGPYRLQAGLTRSLGQIIYFSVGPRHPRISTIRYPEDMPNTQAGAVRYPKHAFRPWKIGQTPPQVC